ncbi:hypothetical protein EK21DRAFT_115663 [Setomelanomma holmii]|uniref:Uncharacterized protein n=1 Tax=Setomelanomma holmii TaxID=210430 RepID=A0A9P4H1F1_9PLEO|nr:hypothetical protein EK21DRAFT_115663 [Setomelanomma holmii]
MSLTKLELPADTSQSDMDIAETDTEDSDSRSPYPCLIKTTMPALYAISYACLVNCNPFRLGRTVFLPLIFIFGLSSALDCLLGRIQELLASAAQKRLQNYQNGYTKALQHEKKALLDANDARERLTRSRNDLIVSQEQRIQDFREGKKEQNEIRRVHYMCLQDYQTRIVTELEKLTKKFKNISVPKVKGVAPRKSNSNSLTGPLEKLAVVEFNFRDTGEIASVFEAIDFLNKTQAVEETIGINFVSIAVKKELFFPSRSADQHFMGLGELVPWGISQASWTGRLPISEDGRRILFETPWDDRPYLYADQPWRGTLVYELDDFRLDQFWLDDYKALRRKAAFEARKPEGEDARSFDAAPLSANWLTLRYLGWIGNKARPIRDGIGLISDEIESKDQLSASTRDLNKWGNELRRSQLGQHLRFGKDAVDWGIQIMTSADYGVGAQDLLHAMRDQIADINIQRQQEREEQRQIQADERLLQEKREQERQDLETKRQDLETKRQDLETKRQEMETKYQDIQQAQREKEAELQDIRDKIMLDTRHDSRTMRGIAWVTIAFIPATFVSSFFGMNFFNGIAGKVPFDQASWNVWLFFVIAVSISVVVLSVFWWWDVKGRNEDEKQLADEREEREGKQG